MLTNDEKQGSIQAAKAHDSDTGSPAVQVSILTDRIKQLDAHLQKNRKDKHSRRGLVGLVERRRKLLSYIQGKNPDLYESVTEKLGLRK